MNDMNTPQEARLYDATAPMSDDGEERMTASENVLAWLLIEKIGVPDDVSYSPDQAQKIIAGQIDWAKELDRINDMLIEAQGDDEGSAIMPEFEKGWSVYAKVEACLHLLERRRDVIEGHSTITDRMIQRVRSAIDAALGERDVGIKPLEWVTDTSGYQIARTSIGWYEYCPPKTIGKYQFAPGIKSSFLNAEQRFATEEEAKDFAQADYAQRIRSALVPSSERDALRDRVAELEGENAGLRAEIVRMNRDLTQANGALIAAEEEEKRGRK